MVASHAREEIGIFMWNYVGIVRSGKRLMQAKTRIENMQDRTKEYCRDFLLTRDLPEPRNIAPAAELIIAW